MLKSKSGKIYLDVIDPDNIEWLRQQRNMPEMRQYFREWKDISKDKQVSWYKAIGNNTADNHVYFEIHADEGTRNADNSTLHDNVGSGELIGCCGLHYIDWRLRSAEFGIFLSQKARGKGFGKDALLTLFDYGFREMNLHKIWAEVYTNNAALDVYTKGIGMCIDGKLRHSQFTDGKYMDSTMLSILEDEWFELHGAR